MTCGIYQIRNIRTDKRYIGSSKDIEQRWDEHLQNLTKYHQDANLHLLRAWRIDGPDSFVWEVIDECEHDQLYEVEHYWINRFWESGLLYNTSKEAGRPPDRSGTTQTSDHISKRITSKKKNGRKWVSSPESNWKRSLSGRGHAQIGHGKGGGQKLKGRKNPRKLTPEKVREIRQLALTQSYEQLAVQFGVSAVSISNVVNRVTWQNID
jgi:group I intron endonuclease